MPGSFEKRTELFFGPRKSDFDGVRFDVMFGGNFVPREVVDVFVEEKVELFGRRFGFDKVERRFGVVVVGLGEVVEVMSKEGVGR